MHSSNSWRSNRTELAVELHESGILDECDVEILGTKLSAIEQAEDRELFRSLNE